MESPLKLETSNRLLAIVKQRLPVELVLEGGTIVRGEVFLLPVAPYKGGRQRLIDLLLEDEPFLPVSTARGTVLLRRDRLVLVRVDDPWDADLATGDELDDAPVVLTLASAPSGSEGAQLTGSIRVGRSIEDRRLIDLLNEEHPFVALLQADGTVMLVAKRYLIQVEEGAMAPPRRTTARTAARAPSRASKRQRTKKAAPQRPTRPRKSKSKG